MSDLEILGGRQPGVTLSFRPWQWRLAAYSLSSIAAVIWALYAGKDLNWDAINYHLYAGFAALNNRFDIDFFAGGLQGYFTPYAHVPLYLMVKAGWSSLAIGIAFALVHSINLWLSYELTLCLLPNCSGSRAYVLAVLAIAFAALNPLFMQETGSSFSDITTSIPVLAGWLALAKCFGSTTRPRTLFAGGFLGLAAALKLSNALYAIAALAVVLMIPGRTRDRLRLFLHYCIACGLGFLLIAGPWAWQLWRHYGNPLFPLFNELFASPDITTEPLKDQRFLPVTLQDALLRPLRMIVPERLIHVEVRAPDARYVALLILIAVWMGRLIWQETLSRAVPNKQKNPEDSAIKHSAFVPVLLGFILAWMLWLAASGNSRYFISMSCVAAALISSTLPRAFGQMRGWVYFTAILLTVQVTQNVFATRYRWNPLGWDGPWFRVGIPDRLLKEPFYYVSFGQQSTSVFLPFLASGSGMLNTSAPHVLEPGGPGGERTAALLRTHASSLRVLYSVGYVDERGKPIFGNPSEINRTLSSLDLAVDARDCETLSLFGGDAHWVLNSADTGARSKTSNRSVSYYQSCKLSWTPANNASRSREQHDQSNTVFNRVEDSCPDLFRPKRISAQYVGDGIWNRAYVNTDIMLWTRDGLVKFRNAMRGGDPIVIGTVADWLDAPQPMDCRKTYSPPFGGLFEDK